MAYWVTIRSRALTLPLTKSESSDPVARGYSASMPSTASLMLKVTSWSAVMKSRASCASDSSACTPYGSRTAVNVARAPLSRTRSTASWHSRPASDES